MSRYSMLVRVLDGIRAEAAGTKFEAIYRPASKVDAEIWQARARAYVHLFLKVMFGVTDFRDREAYITDGARDGGIDGYYIDTSARTIFLIQSKFRNTADNFESKPIAIEEILAMQIRRVSGGEELGEDGSKYNGKIKGLQRRIAEIPDLGRYKYRVVIIANMRGVSQEQLGRLTDGIDAEILNYQEAYKRLLYPVLSGTLFKASGLGITLDLSNKSSGAKIGYSVRTTHYECDITVVFAPTIEIARVMSKYKNSILKYNPRSYLEFEGEKVNNAIRDSVIVLDTNEFAILNNGITIVCDGTSINEQSGRKNRAQLYLLNPQIINGGQTAYTLSRIYDALEGADRDNAFRGKEVMVKAIALSKIDRVEDDRARVDLIERISTATNSQTIVTLADRSSNDPSQLKLQEFLFEGYGLLYERKRGEFSDGVRDGYVKPGEIVGRNVFARVYLAANGSVSSALRSKIGNAKLGPDVLSNSTKMDRFILGLQIFNRLKGARAFIGKRRYVELLPKVYAASVIAERLQGNLVTRGQDAAPLLQKEWPAFLAAASAAGAGYTRTVVDRQGGTPRVELMEARVQLGAAFVADVREYFSKNPLIKLENTEASD